MFVNIIVFTSLYGYQLFFNVWLYNIVFTCYYYYSIIAPFYHIRAKERAKYATLLHCRTGENTD